MRVLRYMLIGRFWTPRELVPLYGSLLLIMPVGWGLMWLVGRIHGPDWLNGIIVLTVMAAWIGMMVRLAIQRIRDIREEEAAGRYLP